MDRPTAHGASAPPAPFGTLLRWWPGWRDAACLALLWVATVHIAAHDGGRQLASLLPVLLLGALVMLATAPTLTRASRWVRWTALAWGGGPLLSLAFADVRAGWVLPVAVASLAGPVVLASLQLLRRPWGGTAILIIAALGGLRAWYWGALVWYGGGSNNRGEPAWMALAWHNQSGALMGALGVGALGVALVRGGPARIIAILIAAAGLSGAWLSGSRGAALLTLAACAVVLLAGLRRSGVRSVVVTAAAAVVTAGGIAALSATYAGVGLAAQPVLSRSQDAGRNAGVRVDYWRAAVGMAAQSPLTGTGPGSYRWSAVPFFPEGTGLTASAHSEQLESLGEQGVLGGGAVVLLTLGFALLALRAMRRAGALDLEVAAAGVVTLLLGHAAIDFDWNYPILFVFLVMAGAILVASARPDVIGRGESGRAGEDAGAPDPRRGRRTDRRMRLPVRALDAAVIAVTLVLLGTAGAGIRIQTRGGPVPWELDRRLLLAVDGAEKGERTAAEAHLATARRWNPGAPRLDAVEALVHHGTGLLDDEALARRVDPGRTAFLDQIRIAARLIQVGRTDLAVELLEEVRPVLEDRRAWRVGGHAIEVASLMLEAAFVDGGCDGADHRRPEAAGWAAERGVEDFIAIVRYHRPGPAPAWVQCDFGEGSAP